MSKKDVVFKVSFSKSRILRSLCKMFRRHASACLPHLETLLIALKPETFFVFCGQLYLCISAALWRQFVFTIYIYSKIQLPMYGWGKYGTWINISNKNTYQPYYNTNAKFIEKEFFHRSHFSHVYYLRP